MGVDVGVGDSPSMTVGDTKIIRAGVIEAA